MAHKVHPTGFRIGINKNYKSLWFADKEVYKVQLHQDLKARKFLKDHLLQAGIGEIVIKRSLSDVSIDISVARPGVVIGRGGKGLEDLKKELDILFGVSVHLDVHDIKKPELNANIVSSSIVSGILKRISIKFLIEKELGKIKDAGAKGAKICVSGRIGGSEIARTEKVYFGSVPLHTLKSDIDYSDSYAKTINFGVIGVKVWINNGIKDSLEEE